MPNTDGRKEVSIRPWDPGRIETCFGEHFGVLPRLKEKR